ncbi:predicted tRNA processing ribonuclease Rbn (RNase BN) [Desulforapulum autotrophicum HRM2]|uniref:Predicted tRNA processing ribonuclease Rbn (RNase BN) n=1 Tax=Desulforapulum autotrophicum (strain ATCC 43914 / DSM 3382 / VKM B-1955 / HRM2) TaxID=177437 RepID=C0QLQ1_DESAH|nr:YihY/virulence factor BrkB family protein [Desulforapulum autotrophicum]ACN16355.1 predicted tRNA processing ribonuclease Rbn (RNase BN) [Desulforapulum autotrophicum HRM2]
MKRLSVRIKKKLTDPAQLRKELKAFATRVFLTVVAAVKGFQKDNCMLRASALTFYTLLSIVPVMAMAFGIAKGFGFETMLRKEILLRLAGHEEAAQRIIDFSGTLLAETKGGVMAAVGVIFLAWAVVKMLGHMEDAFNTIWWIKKGRTLVRKFSDYLGLLFVAPLLLILSGSTTVFILTRLKVFFEATGGVVFVEPFVFFFVKLLPFFTIWILFFFLYMFMPNKKVDIRAAVMGALIAGGVYQMGQMIYFRFQVGVSHYNAIYGSFAALPLFLIWLQASWVLLLLGAEIAFVWEGRRSLNEKEGAYEQMSMRTRKILCLGIVLVCVQRFSRGLKAPSDSEIAQELEIALGVVRMLLDDLVECNILAEITTPSGDRFQPAMDLEFMTVMTVINALEVHGETEVEIPGTMEFEALTHAVDLLSGAVSNAHGDRRLKDI